MIEKTAPSSKSRPKIYETLTEIQTLLDSSAYSIIDFIKANVPADLQDDIILSSSSTFENSSKQSFWDLYGGISIHSSVPVISSATSSCLSPSSSPIMLDKKSSPYSCLPHNIFQKAQTSTPLPNIPENVCEKCARQKNLARYNSGVSEYEGLGGNYKFDASPVNPNVWEILENTISSI